MHSSLTSMKHMLSLLCATAALGLFAQNSNVTNAYNYLQDNDLARAAEFIEPATVHETTMGKEKTWRYRGDIYRLMALGQDETLKAQFPDAMQRAIDSYLKARELDTKGSYRGEIEQGLLALQTAALNKGNDAFSAKDYDRAITLYGDCERISKAFGAVDTNAVFNSALAYETKGDAAKAIARYRECLAMGYDKPEIYRYTANLQKRSGDVDGAISTVRQGRQKYAGQKDLIMDEMSYLLDAGRMAEAEASVQEAISADPENAVLYSILGSLYDGKANPKEGPAPSEAEAAKWTDLAEENYKKTLERDPKFFDAYFNIGVLYNNRAAGCYNKANNIKDNAAYDKAKKACDAVYLKAIPYFEKAHELRPDETATIQQLMKLYAKTDDQAKYAAMKAKLGQ